MINVILENGYFTGMACKVGKFENGVDVESLPNEVDRVKQRAYKLVNASWVFDENKYQELLIVENSKVENEQKQARIAELKALLSSTDYKAIKYAEGILTEQEYLPIKKQRENWRKEINDLEVLLNKEPRIYI